MPEPRILVFGATGALGGHVLTQLVARGVDPAAITAAGRNAARLAELAATGFGTAGVDLSDTARVTGLVADHDETVLISGGDPDRLAQHLSIVDAAKNAAAHHLYYTSGVRAEDDRFAINADHRATEDAIIASGTTYTILRNTWYIENYLQAMGGARHNGVFAAAVGDAVVAAASRKDLAEGLAVAVTTDGHDDVTYSLSGDTDFSYTDIAIAMGVVLGREVTYLPVTPDELRGQLTGFELDHATADFLVSLDDTIAAGAFARVGDDLTRLIGRPSTGLVEGLSGK